MIIYTDGHNYNYECEKIIRIFFPFEKIVFSEAETDTPPCGGANAGAKADTDADAAAKAAAEADGKTDTRRVFTREKAVDGGTEFFCRAEIDGKNAEYGFILPPHDPDTALPDGEKQLASVMVRVFSELTGIIPPWGILTGVRPSKLMHRLADKKGGGEALKIFTDGYLVSEQKAKLALDVAQAQRRAISFNTPDSFSLYISIPFCPTRCSYCSFVSHSIASAKKLIPDYVRLLCGEIEFSAKLASDAGLKLETVYIGGGTPTSLTAEDLKKITETVNSSFDMKDCREFTVEAGRPDTVDREKLTVLKNAGVNRISINPQTFSDGVLKNIGRPHTGADAVEKYLLARDVGFDVINMDFIAGLSGDTFDSFSRSMEKAAELDPENITVHTLALKRSSSLVTEHDTDSVCRDTARMTDFSQKTLAGAGYVPYYMYRQSKSVGNLENIGWCKPGTECLYNIYMMEELHTVVACGGGAVTKLVSNGGEKVERIYNFKYPYEYINRFDEQLDRKKKSGLRIES